MVKVYEGESRAARAARYLRSLAVAARDRGEEDAPAGLDEAAAVIEGLALAAVSTASTQPVARHDVYAKVRAARDAIGRLRGAVDPATTDALEGMAAMLEAFAAGTVLTPEPFVIVAGEGGRDDWREPVSWEQVLERDAVAVRRIRVERADQLRRWGPHADGHTPIEWVALIAKQLGALANHANEYTYRGEERDVARHALRSFESTCDAVGALAIAAQGWAHRERHRPKITQPVGFPRRPEEV